MQTLDDRTFTPAGDLPEALTARAQWICWKYQANGSDKPRKLPCSPDGGALNEWQKNPTQWLSHDDAVAAYQANNNLAGIGFVLTPDTGITGVDMDSAIDTETGEIAAWAQAHLADFGNTYCEVSPSRTGLRVFTLGALPDNAPKKVGNREIYDSGRWLTVTGKTISDEPVSACPDGISRYIDAMQVDGKKAPETGAQPTTGGDIPEGERNTRLTSLAGWLRNGGLRQSELDAALQAANVNRCKPPLSADEVSRIAKSVSRYKSMTDVTRVTKKISVDVEQKIDAIFSTAPANEFVPVPDVLLETVVGKQAQQLARETQIPIGSVFAVLSGLASGIASTSFCTSYESGEHIASGLYVVSEQPSSMQKSRVIKSGTRALAQCVNEHNGHVAELNGEDLDGAKLPMTSSLVTDATTAGLDNVLADTDGGRAMLATAEQGLFVSMFPVDGSFASNNDLLLKGWKGEESNTHRTSRKAFSGTPRLAIVMFAQTGSIQRVLSESNNSGLAERFWFLREPSALGHRKLVRHRLQTLSPDALFNAAVAGCFSAYKRRVGFDNGEPYAYTQLDDLTSVEPDAEGRAFIFSTRVRVEPKLGDLAAAGDLMMSSWLGKIEDHVLKLASTLHVFETLSRGGYEVNTPIPLSLIVGCTEFVRSLYMHMAELVREAGEAGYTAEMRTIFSVIDAGARPVPKSSIVDAARSRKPFYSRPHPYRVASQTVDQMIADNFIFVNAQGRLERA